MKNKKKKIWVLSEIYYPVDISTGYYMTNISEYLAKKGLTVTVLTSTLSYGKGQKKSILLKEEKEGVHINRYHSLFNNKNNPIKRLLNAFFLSLKLSWKLLFKADKRDTVLAVTNPFFLVLFLPLVRKIKKLNYNLIVHDVFPENLKAIKGYKDNNLIYSLIKKIFDRAYKNADTCIVIGRDMEVVIRQKGSKNTCFLPIWSQNLEITPRQKDKTKIIKKLKLENKFVFQFAGNLGLAQGIDNILEAISLIKEDRMHFLFIGEGALEGKVKELSSQCFNVSLLEYQKRETQNDFLNGCDVSFVTLSEGMYGLGVPSKSYNIMAAGKPILFVGDDNSEIALVIKEHEIGWVVEPNNPHKLAEVIDSISQMDQHDLQRMGKISRKLAESKFSRLSILEEYYNLLHE